MDKPIPTDPLIYRFYEIVAIYGTTLKDVIQEIVRLRDHERHRLQDGGRQGGQSVKEIASWSR